jgi:guanosine-3',5'-bis(diphosphate) 3'-pyrophosphohydrolase
MDVPLPNVANLFRALSFAADQHRRQRRKDAEATPYINHPIAVATVLAVEGGVTDCDLLTAALLHDTVEDTGATPEQLDALFGPTVRGLVAELTDDKSLPKQRRKELQVEHARHASAGAKQCKLADKICNLRDVAGSPPSDWSLERKQEYVRWAQRVADGCRGVNPALDGAFDRALEEAERRLTATSRS